MILLRLYMIQIILLNSVEYDLFSKIDLYFYYDSKIFRRKFEELNKEMSDLKFLNNSLNNDKNVQLIIYHSELRKAIKRSKDHNEKLKLISMMDRMEEGLLLRNIYENSQGRSILSSGYIALENQKIPRYSNSKYLSYDPSSLNIFHRK